MPYSGRSTTALLKYPSGFVETDLGRGDTGGGVREGEDAFDARGDGKGDRAEGGVRDGSELSVSLGGVLGESTVTRGVDAGGKDPTESGLGRGGTLGGSKRVVCSLLSSRTGSFSGPLNVKSGEVVRFDLSAVSKGSSSRLLLCRKGCITSDDDGGIKFLEGASLVAFK